jgi:hypothetical protein
MFATNNIIIEAIIPVVQPNSNIDKTAIKQYLKIGR